MQMQNRLEQLRKEKGFTRESFAKYIGIPYSTLRNYESGTYEPRMEFWIQMSQYFEVSLDYMLGMSDEKENCDITKDEYEFLEGYSKLDSQGKELVDLVIEQLTRD